MSIFNSVSIPLKKRNKFDLSYESRLTTDFGRLTPILCEPVLPNDRFRISTNLRVQFAPMKFPVMQKFQAYIHYWFVPNRLLWDNWETFITGGEDGLQEPSYPFIPWNDEFCDEFTTPQLKKAFCTSSLFDYLGFPALASTDDPADTAGHEIDAMPFKAYQLIYNEWYRDQNLSEPIDILKDIDGKQDNSDDFASTMELMKLRTRAWRKDYFTSALPDPQRGPDVTLPIVGDMGITGSGNIAVGLNNVSHLDGSNPGALRTHSSGGDIQFLRVPDNGYNNDDTVKISGNLPASDVAEKLGVNSEGVRSATINEVRRAFAIQRWYELAARAGARYVEQILAHFGIRSSDSRLQRPEYIGGSVVPVFIGDVLQTSESDTTPLGTPAGVGQAAGRVKPVIRTFEEHGWIIGILSVLPQAAYMQGIPRKYLKRDKFDFAWPLLANIGEQEIERQELYFDYTQTPTKNKEGFGYTPRYAEYKYGAGQVHGDFRTSLADFHDARIFDSAPALNTEFIECRAAGIDNNGGLNRIFSVTTGMVDHLWVYLYNDIKVRRVLPKYGTPI